MKAYRFIIALLVLVCLISGCAVVGEPLPTPSETANKTPSQLADDAIEGYIAEKSQEEKDPIVLEETIVIVNSEGESVVYEYENGELVESNKDASDFENSEYYQEVESEDGVTILVPKAILKVESVTVKPGEKFSFLISIDNYPLWDWATFEFYINYDPEIISINDIVTTEYTTNMILQTNLEYTPASAYVAAISIDDFNEPEGNLVEVRCTALKTGEVEITLGEFMMYRVVTLPNGTDINSEPIFLIAESGKITVTE